MASRIVVFSLFISIACAATWMGSLPPKPKEFVHKQGCYVEEINDVVPFGTTLKPIGHCHRIECSERMMYYASCGAVLTDDPKCHITDEDLKKPYPECCPDIKCEVDNNLV